MSKEYTLTINIEDRGTLYTTIKDGVEVTSPSIAGHMWYSISDGVSKDQNFGFASENGLPIDAGDPVDNDANNYAGDPAYSVTINVSEEQYNSLKNYGKSQDISSFNDDYYNVATNSCVDYVYGALEVAGLNTNGFEGDLIPMNNVDNIQEMLSSQNIIQESFDGISVDELFSSENSYSSDTTITNLSPITGNPILDAMETATTSTINNYTQTTTQSNTWEDFGGLDLIIDTYQYNIAKNLIINELGGVSNGYEISNAGTGNSSWSFGGQQLDIANNSTASDLMKNILDHEYGEGYYDSVESLLKGDSRSFDNYSDIKNEINSALSSEYGQNAINTNFVSEVNNIATHINTVETMLGITLSNGEKLMLADYHNQYNLSLNTTTSNSMFKKLQDMVTQKGDISVDDIKGFMEETTYAQDNSTQQQRISNIYQAAKELDSIENPNNPLDDLPPTSSGGDKNSTDLEILMELDEQEKDFGDGDILADSGQIATDAVYGSYDSYTNTITYTDKNGNQQQLTYNEENDLLIYGDLTDPDKITFTDPNTGEYQEWGKDENGIYVRTDTIDYSRVTNTAINQIGSLIIANNENFSNIEKSKVV